MSFTAEVKDELSRIDAVCSHCDTAQLAALIRVCGTLSFHGSGAYSLRVSTETGAVARTVIKLVHRVFDLETQLTVRRSVLHKARNYLIEILEQEDLEAALISLGVLRPGRGLTAGISKDLVKNPCCVRSFIRGAFMAGGFVADPRGDFHLEISVTGENFAQDIVRLFAMLGIPSKLNRRRGFYAVYLKSFESTVRLLASMGASRSALAVENVRVLKSVKNDVNRRVNAEIANQARSCGAAAEQVELIEKLDAIVGIDTIPRALRAFCVARCAHPDLSLADLGAVMEPKLSKSAVYHRLLRVKALLAEAENAPHRVQTTKKNDINRNMR